MIASRLSPFGFVLAIAFAAHAADKPVAPTLDHLYPVGAIAGTRTAITAVGKLASWPPKVWTDVPGISFHAGEKAGQFSVEVSADVPAGPHLVRFFNETGASAPRVLIVASGPEQTETEPNDEFAKASLIEQLPIIINGRLNKNGDVDSYAVQLHAGQTLFTSLDAYVLGSPVDAVLRIVDARGVEQAFNHDNGRNPDPALTWTARVGGTYILQVFGFAHPATADVRFTGSDACVYRLHLKTGDRKPETGNVTETRIPDTEEPRESRGRKSETGIRAHETATLSRATSPVSGLRSPVSSGSAVSAPPFALDGCIEHVGELDRFQFNAKKEEKLVLAVRAASGSPLDAWLAVQDVAGKELVRNDDGASADPLLEWTVPENGTYVAVVGSVLHRAGLDHRYQLTAEPARPSFQGVIAESGFTLEPGKSIKIKVTARRLQGFQAALTASVTGLPEGLSADSVDLKEGEKEITLEVTAAAEAPSFSGPIQVVFREKSSDVVHHAIHEFTSTASRNGVPQGFRDLLITSTDQLWLTVLPGR